MANVLVAIKYKRGSLEILDQTLLPESFDYVSIKNTEDAWHAIKDMKVRGAPAIAITGCLGLITELQGGTKYFHSVKELIQFVDKRLQYLVSARPTAVNMKEAASQLSAFVKDITASGQLTVDKVINRIIAQVEEMLKKDVSDNKKIGRYGADCILEHSKNQPVSVVTHCNTGSLATAGYGTALGVVRSLHEREMLEHIYCTETRPYNQGSRLTAYEIKHDQMPGTLITDSMVAMLMKEKKISAVVVGADRVVANGDTANKIGTYQLAIVAKHHGVAFYVAAPRTSCDMELESGDNIVIEERSSREMTHIKGVAIAPEGMTCWNPAFDITPAELITGGIITEHGVFSPSELKEKLASILTVPSLEKKSKIE